MYLNTIKVFCGFYHRVQVQRRWHQTFSARKNSIATKSRLIPHFKRILVYNSWKCQLGIFEVVYDKTGLVIWRKHTFHLRHRFKGENKKPAIFHRIKSSSSSDHTPLSFIFIFQAVWINDKVHLRTNHFILWNISSSINNNFQTFDCLCLLSNQKWLLVRVYSLQNVNSALGFSCFYCCLFFELIWKRNGRSSWSCLLL